MPPLPGQKQPGVAKGTVKGPPPKPAKGPAQTPKKPKQAPDVVIKRADVLSPKPATAKAAPKPAAKAASKKAPAKKAPQKSNAPSSPPKKRPVAEIQFANDELLHDDEDELDELDDVDGLDDDMDDLDGGVDGPMIIDMPAANAPRAKKPTRKPLANVGPPRCGTIALVGRPNVGKSSLLNALLGQKIAATTHKPQTTRRALRGVLTEGNTQLVFVDTPGLHEEHGGLFSFMLDEALDAAVETNVLCFLVEADRKRQGIHKSDEEALQRLLQRAPTTPVVLVISKIDVLEDKEVLLPLLQAWSASGRFAGYVPLSAHKHENLEGLVKELASLMPEAPFVFPPDSLTDQSERDIAAELIREKVMLELQQEIPYRTAVLVEHFDESRRDDDKKPLVHIAAVIVVEKDSQKSMVIGKGGQRIKVIGQRARKDLEHLLQCQVHLELFVKVEKDWTQTGAGLRKLGYSRTT